MRRRRSRTRRPRDSRVTSVPSISTAPRVGPVDAGEQPQQRRLARPRRAHQRGERAAREYEVDARAAPAPRRRRGGRPAPPPGRRRRRSGPGQTTSRNTSAGVARPTRRWAYPMASRAITATATASRRAPAYGTATTVPGGRLVLISNSLGQHRRRSRRQRDPADQPGRERRGQLHASAVAVRGGSQPHPAQQARSRGGAPAPGSPGTAAGPTAVIRPVSSDSAAR